MKNRSLFSLLVLVGLLLSSCGTLEIQLETPAPANPRLESGSAAPSAEMPSPAAKIVTSPAASPASDDPLTIQYLIGMASGMTLEQVPAAEGADLPYWQILPGYTQITLEGYPISDHIQKPQIFVYNVDEFSKVNETAGKVIAGLSGMMKTNTVSQIAAEQSAPFLPLDNTQQLIHARVRELSFQNGQGITFLTQSGQSYTPIRNQELIYTYQGLTQDGKYYVAAVLPVTLLSLPTQEKPPAGV